jgi:hypothetical protein
MTHTTKKADAVMRKIQKHNTALIKLWNKWKRLTYGRGAI